MTNAVEPNKNEAPTPDAGEPLAADRATDRSTLERELLDEMTGWSTRDRGGIFKTWHRHALSLVHLNVLTALEAEGPLSMRRLAEAMTFRTRAPPGSSIGWRSGASWNAVMPRATAA